jgi:hypothetical protein
MSTADLLKEYRKSINPPYTNKDFLVILLTFIILVLVPLTVTAALTSRQLVSRAAASASTSLSPASLSVNHGADFSVEIRENSGTEPVNAVQTNLTFDPNKLEVVSIDGSSSPFEISAQQVISPGLIKIGRGTVTPVTGDQLVSQVNFRAKFSVGPTVVDFTTGTKVVSSVTNTDIFAGSVGGTYTIVDPPPTVTITNPADNEVVSGTVMVSATANDDLAVTKVDFLVDGSVKKSDTSSPYNYNLDTTTLSNTTHTITAQAFDANNSVTDSITISVDNQPPSTPTGLSATAIGGSQVDLSWNASTDNIGVTGYDVYRDGSKIATVTNTNYSDTGLAANTTYVYFVEAKDGQGNVSGASSSVSATTYRRGDLNQDGTVDVVDLSIMLSDWESSDPVSDINGDGTVDVVDLSIMLSNWTL